MEAVFSPFPGMAASKEDLGVVVWQRQKNPVSASALPTGKLLRVRKVFARIYKIYPKISLESFQTVWKVSKKVWKVSRQSGKFTPKISLESFQTVSKTFQ